MGNHKSPLRGREGGQDLYFVLFYSLTTVSVEWAGEFVYVFNGYHERCITSMLNHVCAPAASTVEPVKFSTALSSK